MAKKIGVIGAGGVGSSTLIQAVLKMESEILSTYRLIEAAYPLQGKKVPTLAEFRKELKERVETSPLGYVEMCNRYKMGCLYIEQPRYEEMDPDWAKKFHEAPGPYRGIVKGKG